MRQKRQKQWFWECKIMEIDWNTIDKKWQKQWLENNDHEADSNNKEKKFITVAYPYPNSPQHIGHGRTCLLYTSPSPRDKA